MAIDVNTLGTPNTGVGDIAKGIGSLYDLYTGVAGTDINRAREAANMADPFATQRGQYQTQLQQLLTDPNSFKTDPGYQFALGQGQQAVGNASDALYGTRRNGALAPELAKYTEGYAKQAYDTRISQLTQLAGGNSGSPGTAGMILSGGFDKNQSALAGGTLGALAPLINYLGSPGALGGLGGLPNISSGLGGSQVGFGNTGYSIDPQTGNITYGSGANSSTGFGDQGGFIGDTSGTDFTGPNGFTAPPFDPNLMATSPTLPDDFSWLIDGLG